MTDTEINIAIAQTCHPNWRIYQPNGLGLEQHESGVYAWVDREMPMFSIPNYVNDLNAMHEAEQHLQKRLLTLYDDHLNALVLRDCSTRTEPFPPNQAVYEDLSRWKFHATSRQRAEAFLCTISKWKD